MASTVAGAWVYKRSGAVGLRHRDEIHVTDWGTGACSTVRRAWPALAPGWDGARVVFGSYPSQTVGYLQAGQIWVTDWPSPNELRDQWPGLPVNWNPAMISSAWVYPSGVVGLRLGGEVHLTDWPNGTTKTIPQTWPTLPVGWANPDIIFGTYANGAVGFIKDDLVWATDWPGRPTTLRCQWPSIPDDWPLRLPVGGS